MDVLRANRDCDSVAPRLTFVRSIAVIALALSLFGPAPARADLGDCSQPTSLGEIPVVSDCLFILNVAVGSLECPEPQCICAPSGVLPTTATDALFCLRHVVGLDTPLDCPCNTTTTTLDPGPTTTTTVDAGPTTTTTTTTTTLPAGSPCGSTRGKHPICGGVCDEGETCTNVRKVGCACVPMFCGEVDAPQCFGVCPPQMRCTPKSGMCRCQKFAPNGGQPFPHPNGKPRGTFTPAAPITPAS
jgi:hypothetical protein